MTKMPRYEVVGKSLYRLLEDYEYVSPRYGKQVVCPAGMESDGATGAFDIYSAAWWVHDNLCETAEWSDGTPVNAFQAATVLGDILVSEGRVWRGIYWWWATYLLGCKKPRENGWF